MSRLRFLKIVLGLIMGVILVRLFWVQIIEYEYWAGKAEAQHTLENTIVAKRGEIYMMDGSEPVAVVKNRTVYTMIIDPLLADEEEVGLVLEQEAKDYAVVSAEEAFADKRLRYYVVAKELPIQVAEVIRVKGLNGVWFQSNTKRVYPEGSMASALLGFVNLDGVGQYGVEGALNQQLAGENGLLKTVTDVNRVALSIGSENVRQPAVDGDDVVLTIDRNIQYRVEKILLDKMQNSIAERASALVMKARGGQIMALADVPNYNPEKYAEVKDLSVYRNNVTEGAYEPASVCKAFSFAAAVDSGVMQPSTTFINEGSVKIDGETIENAYRGKYGEVDMQTALNYSLNTGSIHTLRLMSNSKTNINEDGRRVLYDYYHNRFGFGQYTGIELYEVPGSVPLPDQGYARNLTYANMTFGQGINMTVAQAAAAFAAVVNGGDYYQPTVVAGKMINGKLERVEPKEVVRKVVSPETSSIMREMLYNTRGRKRLYWIDQPGYYMGGKTGTAQVFRDGKYSDAMGETIASYVGFGGAVEELPEYVIMVKIWGEGKHLEGERDAAPVFDTINNYLLDYLKIKPKG